ncbi:MAG: hypothetical protein KAY37_13845, partial [Phycisphaerae bacterium]|nr:hypothetical protein [Phycisphaerae bacterium]
DVARKPLTENSTSIIGPCEAIPTNVGNSKASARAVSRRRGTIMRYDRPRGLKPAALLRGVPLETTLCATIDRAG